MLYEVITAAGLQDLESRIGRERVRGHHELVLRLQRTPIEPAGRAFRLADRLRGRGRGPENKKA